MQLYIKQKVFSLKDKFFIYDENGNEKYYVEGQMFSFGKKLHLFKDGNEVSFIHQKVWSFLPCFFISVNGEDVARVKKQFTFMHQEYTVEGPDWRVTGDMWQHEYDIVSANGVIAHVSKHWFSWGDTYELNIDDNADEALAVSVVLIIDAVLAMQSSSSASD